MYVCMHIYMFAYQYSASCARKYPHINDAASSATISMLSKGDILVATDNTNVKYTYDMSLFFSLIQVALVG